MLLDASWCPKKPLSSMSTDDLVDLFSELEYNDDHLFAHCLYEEKRRWFEWGSKSTAEEASNSTVQKTNQLLWEVTNHNET
jgi:hypothetical protein